MDDPLHPFEGLYDRTEGHDLALPAEIATLYGPLRFADRPERPYVISNFVTSLDGVVSLGRPGTGGREISGDSREDRFVMALLRAIADVVIVGAGTLRAYPRHVWTPEAIDAPRADAYTRVRTGLGKSAAPTTVIVTGTGDLDTTLPVFTTGRAPAVVVTTKSGARALTRRAGGPLDVRIAGDAPFLDAVDILRVLDLPRNCRVLLECGPQLMARFLAARLVDELFLTLAPQIAGRDAEERREGLAAGVLFLPDQPVWAGLLSLKKCRELLYLRYQLPSEK